ncbi:altered inheritance rate of mitochondria protein 25-like [Triticum dicoccoides]|uniref:altered inheritance rate of mitochondria protein 25-like n=1 Tax=Triticum dicoccoides TaxID=85692 RepID=UPI00188EB767|nr:altered inheritance rate of mitochondria protein 25-like [Triticum dicoccoides]
MWRLPGLLSQAAAAGRAAARTRSSDVRGSKGFSSGGDGSPLPRGWLRRLWVEELKREKEAARRLGGGALVCKAEGVGEDSLGYLANAARAFVNSGSAAAGIDKVSAGGAARGEVAPSKGGHYDPKDLPYLEAKLEPLLSRANLLIARDVEWANIMFAFEQESRYIIMDPLFSQSPVGYIREKSNVIFRQLLRSRRPFTAQFTDAMGNEIFTVRRPFWFINSSIYAEVDGKEVGVVHRRWHLWRRIYDLYLGNKQFAVVENPGFWNWTFTLIDEDENVLAQIDRNWRGIGFELFTDAGQYAIRFGDDGQSSRLGLGSDIEELNVVRPLSLPERAVALALAVSLDSDYFSRRGGWGLPFLIATE